MTSLRVAQRTVNLAFSGTDDYYEVTLKLSNRAAPALGGGGGTGGFPHPPPGEPSLVQYKGDAGGTVTLDTVPSDGSLLMIWASGRAIVPGTPTGFTVVGDGGFSTAAPGLGYGRLFTKIASGETGTYQATGGGVQILAMEFSGSLDGFVAQNDQGRSTTMTSGGAITPSAANAIVVGCAVTDGFFGVTITPGTGVTELWDSMTPGSVPPCCWVGYKSVATPASTSVGGTIVPSAEYFGGVTFSVIGSSGLNPPRPGQWVYGETPTPAPGGGTVTFATAFPFAAGSLVVRVDNVNQTAAISSSDGAAGTFTLAFDPRSWETLSVDYQGI